MVGPTRGWLRYVVASSLEVVGPIHFISDLSNSMVDHPAGLFSRAEWLPLRAQPIWGRTLSGLRFFLVSLLQMSWSASDFQDLY